MHTFIAFSYYIWRRLENLETFLWIRISRKTKKMPETPPSSNAVYKNFRFESFDPRSGQYEYYLQKFDIHKNGYKNIIIIYYCLKSNNKDLWWTNWSVLMERPYIFAERTNFAGFFRKETETIIQYAVALRSLAGNCSFGTIRWSNEVSTHFWDRQLKMARENNSKTFYKCRIWWRARLQHYFRDKLLYRQKINMFSTESR